MKRLTLALTALLLTALPLTAIASTQCTQNSLRIAVIPKTSMEALLKEHKPLIERLHSATGMPVEIVPSSSYESVVDAIVSGGVDIAWLGPASYMLAYQRDPRIEPFAALTMSHGYFTHGSHRYQSLLLVLNESDTQITSLRGKRVALTDPASTSGSVVPNAEFSARIGAPLAQYFGSITYSGSHDKSLNALLTRKVDAAFVSSVLADAYLSNGMIGRDTFKVLWRSQPIYNDPFVFSGTLCASLKTRIRSAMLSDQDTLAQFLTSQDASGIVPVHHADYAPLLHMLHKPPAVQ